MLSLKQIGVKRSSIKKKLHEVSDKNTRDLLERLLSRSKDEYTGIEAIFIVSNLVFTSLDNSYISNPSEYKHVPAVRVHYTAVNNRKLRDKLLIEIASVGTKKVTKPSSTTNKKSTKKNSTKPTFITNSQKTALVNIHNGMRKVVHKNMIKTLLSIDAIEMKIGVGCVLTGAGLKVIEDLIGETC